MTWFSHSLSQRCCCRDSPSSRATLFADLHFVLAMVVATFGLFVVIALLSVFVLRHAVGAAAIQAVSATYSNASFRWP